MSARSLKIITLIENEQGDHPNLVTEHGLSFYIEYGKTRLLFDTGQTGAFLHNASELNIDLSGTDALVLSHSHYDHTGGVTALLHEACLPKRLIVGMTFFEEKYKRLPSGDYLFRGNAFEESTIEARGVSIDYVTRGHLRIAGHIHVFTEFEQITDFEEVEAPFYVKRTNGYEKDMFQDEVVLALDLPDGLFIVTGCAHIGIVNILQSIQDRTGKAIIGLIGGTHLVHAGQHRIEQTIEYLKTLNLKYLGACHCTGEEGVKRLKDVFGDVFIEIGTGHALVMDATKSCESEST